MAEVYDTVSARALHCRRPCAADNMIADQVVIVEQHATHECAATMEFARKLMTMADGLKAELIVVMRVRQDGSTSGD